MLPSLQFLGCLQPLDVNLTGVTCPDAPATDNDLSLRYRHFAVDEDNAVVFFCDRKPSAPAERPACYASAREKAGPDWDGEISLSVLKNMCALYMSL